MTTEMNSTPAPREEVELSPENYCTIEESKTRLSTCISCENFYTDEDQHTKCRGCGCNVSMLITIKDKTCPSEKW